MFISSSAASQPGHEIPIKTKAIFDENVLFAFKQSKKWLENLPQYNNKPHSTDQDLTPNQMEEAYFHKHQNEHPEGKITTYGTDAKELMLTEKGSIQHTIAQTYKDQIIDEYKGDWLRFFLDWKKEQQEQHQKVIETVVQSKDEVISKLEEKAQRDKEKAQQDKERYT